MFDFVEIADVVLTVPTDIAGANAVGWPSILVETGVYNPEDGPPAHRPTTIKSDVESAVRWAMEQELQRLR